MNLRAQLESRMDRHAHRESRDTHTSSPLRLQIAEEELARRPSASAMETLQKTLAIQTPYWETLRANPDTALLSHLEAWERERDREGRLLQVGSELAHLSNEFQFSSAISRFTIQNSELSEAIGRLLHY